MEEQLNMMRRGRQFKQLMNKKMDGVILSIFAIA
mgnify:CR=1 FL=1